MFSIINRFLLTPWKCCITRAVHAWKSFLTLAFGRATWNLKPLTEQQREERTVEFIHSIDKDAVRALASEYNGHLPCDIRYWRQGSYNVCFVVDFPNGTTRVVRIPIEPAVHNVWEKVQSEVYTMQ